MNNYMMRNWNNLQRMIAIRNKQAEHQKKVMAVLTGAKLWNTVQSSVWQPALVSVTPEHS